MLCSDIFSAFTTSSVLAISGSDTAHSCVYPCKICGKVVISDP